MTHLGRPGVLLAAIGVALLGLPFAALLVDVPWTRLGSILSDDAFGTALRTSLIVVPSATAIVFVLGTPLAWWMAHGPASRSAVVRALVVIPVVLPPVVSGLVLLSAFGRRGLLGPALEAIGIVLPFTLGATVLAAVFVSLPFYVLAAENGFRSIAPAIIDAARTLGTPHDRMLAAIGPAARPAILTGLVLAAARALGEFGATITFAGNVEGATRTLPLATFAELEQDPDVARVLGLALVAIALTVIVALRSSLVRR